MTLKPARTIVVDSELARVVIGGQGPSSLVVHGPSRHHRVQPSWAPEMVTWINVLAPLPIPRKLATTVSTAPVTEYR
jgi:hypothetical protein